MADERFDRLQALFVEVLDVPDAQRDEWINRQCADDEALKSRLLQLLRQSDRACDPLEKGVLEAVSVATPAEEKHNGPNDSEGTEFVECTPEDFVQRLETMRVLSDDELQLVRQQALDQQPGPSTVQIAEQLMRNGRLTAFQRERLLSDSDEPLVIGNYVLRDAIGRGGMGQVFLARHRRMKRDVAIKTIPRELTRSPDTIERFEREVEATARLNHPHIVMAHDADEAEGVHYLVMEYVPGQDLGALVRQRGPVPVAEAVDYILQAARGLEAAHAAGVLHRDVKPSNLLLGEDGRIKVADFGLARLQAETRDPFTRTRAELTATGTVLGTVDFLAPEQARQIRDADDRADVYSLGCTLYYLLTGEPVYPAASMMEKIRAHQKAPIPSLPTRNNEIPLLLDRVFRQMVAKRPQDRPQTMSDVIRVLQPFAAVFDTAIGQDETTVSRSSAGGETLKLATERPAWRLRILGGIVLVTLAIGGLWFRFGPRWQTHAERAPSPADSGGAAPVSVVRAVPGTAAPDSTVAGSVAPLSEPDLSGVALRLRATLRGQSQLQRVGVSADGSQVVAGDDQGLLLLWDVETEAVVHKFSGHTRPIWDVALSATDPWVASSSGDDTVRVWNMDDGALIHTIPNETRYGKLAFTPRSGQLALGDLSGRIRLFDPTGSNPPVDFQTLNSSIRSMAFSPTGDRLAAACRDSSVRTWDATTGGPVATHPSGTGAPLWDVDFLADGRQIAAVSNKGVQRVVVWDATAEGAARSVVSDHHHRIAGHPLMPIVATSQWDVETRTASLFLWHSETGALLTQRAAHGEEIRDLSFSRDGRTLASASNDGTAKVWDLFQGASTEGAREPDGR